MKIITAPDSYRESLSASEATQTIERGFRGIFPDVQYVSAPAADGGEGAVKAMIAATQGAERHIWVTGPLGEEVNVSWGISGDGKTALIEMTAASGLEPVPAEKRDLLVAASHSIGELILQALENGTANTTVSIGGSVTNDDSIGMVQALGVKLRDTNDSETDFGGGSPNALNDIDISNLDPRLKDCVIRVACDVTNPLVDDSGASRIFGPQKGASEAVIAELGNNPPHYADVTREALHVDVEDVLGAGAMGGMGAALMAFLGAELKSDIETVTTALDLEERIHDCTPVVTGEGRINNQSIRGKVPIGIANVAKEYHKPVIGTTGSLINDVGVIHRYGIDAVLSVLTSTGTLDKAFRGAYSNICRTSHNITATLVIGMRSAG